MDITIRIASEGEPKAAPGLIGAVGITNPTERKEVEVNFTEVEGTLHLQEVIIASASAYSIAYETASPITVNVQDGGI